MLTLDPSCNERLIYRSCSELKYLEVFSHKVPLILDMSDWKLLQLHPQLKELNLLISKLMILQSKITNGQVNQSS